jgi:hypothetical protein
MRLSGPEGKEWGTGEGIRCRMAAEREVAEEKQIPRSLEAIMTE